MRKNQFVTVLKYIACYCVIFSHALPLAAGNRQYDIVYRLSNGRTSIGGCAVILFFFFSGYYIAESVSRTTTFLEYSKKRVRRLILPLSIVIVISLIVCGLFFSAKSRSEYFLDINTWAYLKNIFLKLTPTLPGVFENNIFTSAVNGSLWILPIQAYCYVFAWLLKELNLYKKYLNICLLGGVLSLTLNPGHKMVFIVFIFGEILFMLKDKIREYPNKSKNIVVLFITGIVIATFPKIAEVSLAFYIPLVLFYCIFDRGYELRIKRNLPDYTYEIYLCAYPIQQSLVAINGGSMDPILNFILASILASIAGLGIKRTENWKGKYRK